MNAMNQPIVSTLPLHEEGDLYQRLLNSLASLPTEEGIRQIKAFLQTYPSFATAHNDLGVLYLRGGNATLALAHYEKAARLQPDNTTFKKNLADFYAVELGWYDDAVDMYLDILKKNPRDTEALIALGQLGNAMQSGAELPAPEIKPALEQSQKVHATIQHKPEPEPLKPPTAEQLHHSAAELIQQGKTREAHSILEQLLAYHPNYAAAHNDLGILWQQEGDMTAARRHHEQALQLQPENLTFKKNLADLLYLACDDTEAALQHYVEILRRFPKDIDALTALSRICIENNQFDDARAFLKSILSVEPWNMDARQALDDLNEIRKENIHPPPTHKTAEEIHAEAVRHAREERHHEAHSLLEELVHLHPDFATGYNDLGVTRYRLGDIHGSHKAYQQAVKLQPTNLNFRKNLADLLYAALGKTDEAIRIYLDLHKSFPRDIETLIALGQICAANNQVAEAKHFFRRALEIEPWNMDARNAMQQL